MVLINWEQFDRNGQKPSDFKRELINIGEHSETSGEHSDSFERLLHELSMSSIEILFI